MKSYRHAAERCNNKNNVGYHKYGGKGIRFMLTAQEIKSIWLRDRASEMDRPSIDRIDSSGDYALSNCRFIEQVENSRRGGNECIRLYGAPKTREKWKALSGSPGESDK